MEEKIRNLIEGEVLKLGVSIDSVEYVKEGQNYFLRIVIDRDEPIDIDKCVEVTNVINPLLDNIDFIEIRHFDSEKIVTEILKERLWKKFGDKIEIYISKAEVSPLLDTDEIL